MAHDVFISHSSKDKAYADEVCARLEAEGIRCWIAPRDILPGMAWGSSIVEAIEAARLMVLVFSANANSSPQIEREVERALNKQVTIVPLRIEPITPGKSLEYFLGTPQWLDAVAPPFEQHLEYIAQTIKVLLHRGEPGQPAEIPHPRDPVPPPVAVVPPPVGEVVPPPVAAPPPPVVVPHPPARKLAGPILAGAAAIGVVVVLIVLGWWLIQGGPVPRKLIGVWTTTNFVGPDKVQFVLRVGESATYRYETTYRESGKVHISGGEVYLETADGLERPVGPVAAGSIPPTPIDLMEAVPDGVWGLISRFSHTRAEPPRANLFTLVQAGRPKAGTDAQPAVWEWDAAFGRVAWQIKFQFAFDKSYTFTAHASDAGRFAARKGKWKAVSDVLDNQTEGSYYFVGDNSLVLAGTIRGAVTTTAGGNTLWERLGTVKAAPAPGVSAAAALAPSAAPTVAAIASALPTGGATITATSAPTGSPKATATPARQPIMALDRRFLLSQDSDVYANPDSSSTVVGHLRRGSYVHITGLTGNWLRVMLYSRTVGFIPDAAVE
jgi:hypothetical protein